MPGQALLSVRGVTVRFGGVTALDRVSLDVRAGEIRGLIGPNGAGKTTAFDVITRLRQPEEGALELDGESLLATPPHRVAARGVARTFQSVRLFESMTALENVLVGAHTRGRAGGEGEARALLGEVGLADAAGAPVRSLPYAAQKRVELARALAAAPRLLLLDEPAGGLDRNEVAELAGLVRRLRDERGLTVLLVEHHMGLVLEVTDRVTVLSFGRTIAEGPPAAVRRDPAVVEAYLGADDAG
jgi:branched-chain amino acid transport system ATP-binding protein